MRTITTPNFRMSRLLLHAARALMLVGCVVALTDAAAGTSTAKLIVKFRDAALKATPVATTRVARLAAESEVTLRHVRPMSLGADVIALESPLPIGEVEAIAARLAQSPDVEYAHPDRPMRPDLTPNDSYILAQSYLINGPAAISAYAAWDTTTGNPNTVVAVVDTGYTNHVGMAGRFLAGYDFINTLWVANDGDLRDPDAHDPGDWVTQADKDMQPPGFDCTIGNSSWHGLGVASIIAANGNDHAWTAGINWAAKVLPARALGKCGGDSSDIIDAVAWSGGLSVIGVPANPTPAQVINLSLGGKDATCDPAYQNVINAVLAHGVTRAIIAAAGNDNEDFAGHEPANCAGVISVAATNQLGDKASFSNFGTVSIAAPGNNIYLLLDSGTTSPAGDFAGPLSGTSMAAPMVSGVVSLMLGVAPNLTAADVRAIITSTAKPFPAGSTCAGRCGAGIVDANAAVQAAIAKAGPLTIDVVEYYNAALDHYFITWVAAEQANLDAGNTPTKWTRTGYSFKTFTIAQTGTSPVCRYYIPPAKGDSHFFGRGVDECNATGQKNPTFVLEDPAFMQLYLPNAGTCPANTTPIYRVFDNRPDANHRYMTDPAVRAQMVAKGWIVEGDGPDMVVMCAPQ